nr:pentatricopeptide repeat-containing protein At4g21705, mitochondrial-like isoform X2 [Coffea arabica]
MLKMQSLSRRLSLFQTLISVNSRVKNTQKFYCTNQIVINSSRGGNQSNREGEEIRKKEKKETLYSRISPLGNPKTKIGPVLDQWVESGQKVRFAELRRIIHDLRKRSRFSHALQMMKEKGLSLSSVAYNDIMVLYTKVGQHEKVPDVLIRMQDNGVSPDNLSYRLCINSYGVRSDMDGIKNVLREMEYQPNISMDWNTYAVVANFYIKEGLKDEANSYLQRAEKILDNNDNEGYNHLISLHANLGNKAQVFRLWALEKNTFKKCINKDYLNMLKSLVRIDEFESALECLKEWESSGNCYDFRVPNTIILGYIEKGLCEKAEAMLKGLMGEGKAHSPESWGRLSAGYLHKDEMEKAVECMKVALSFCGQREGWKPDPSVLTKLNNFLGDKGSMEDTEALIRA